LPTYTYTCTSCNDVIEKRQSFSDAPLTTCEQCGGSLRKVFHPVGIVFKGSGWYVTDSRSSSSTAVSGNGTAANKPAESSESSKPAETSKPAEAPTTSTTSTTSATSASSKD
jgi:putative FmdB family regulatory protein